MGSTTVQQMTDRVADDLNDSSHAHWPESQLRGYLEDGQRAAVLLRPEVNPVTALIKYDDSVQQKIPDNGFVLLDVVRSHGSSNEMNPGRAITPIARTDIDQTDPDWAQEPAGVPENFIYDIRNRKVFYVSPKPTRTQADRTTHCEIVFSAAPGLSGNKIEVDDIYVPALLSYMFHRAYLKDIASEGQGAQRADFFWRVFMELLLGRVDDQDVEVNIRNEIAEMNQINKNRARARARSS